MIGECFWLLWIVDVCAALRPLSLQPLDDALAYLCLVEGFALVGSLVGVKSLSGCLPW